MNQIMVNRAKMNLEDALNQLSDEKQSRQISIAKTKIEEALFWINDATDIEQVFE